MIDIAVLRERRPELEAALARRGRELDLDALTDLDERRRQARARSDDLRAEQRQLGKEISGLEGDEKQAAIERGGLLSEEYKGSSAEADAIDAEFERVWVTVPNLPHESVPEGGGEEDNVELKQWGAPPAMAFEPRDHLDIGTALGIIDTERAVKVSGSRFGFIMGGAALLELSLVRFAMDHLVAAGFVPVVPPVLVREQALFGTGFFPDDQEQVYAIEADDLYLAGTSEIPLASYHTDEILEEAGLPLHYAGFSTCFRREAGTYGKDTKGIWRVHQFDKVEMFSYCIPETSWDEHELLLSLEEEIVQALEIPYRVVNVCTGDLGPAAAKKYDIEAWLPSKGGYGEITSCSNTTDFQSRRLKVRYRGGKGTRLVHTLNGTAVAVGRTLVALLENHQRDDGTVAIPQALHAYTGFEALTKT